MIPPGTANDDAPALGEPTGVLGLLAKLGTRVLVADGAMGTMLHAGGVSLDRCLPELSLSEPELVRAIHCAYLTAGARLIETNTFGASRFRLARHGLEGRVAEINRAGVRLARQTQEEAGTRSIVVAGAVGPVTPVGSHLEIPTVEIRNAFHEQIGALVEAGVDLLVFETFSSLAEMVEAVETARAITSAPLVAQMSFVEDGRTLFGDTPADVGTTLESLGVSAIGANCILGPQALLDVLRELGRHTRLPLVAQPTAGPPTLLYGSFRYSASTSYFARYARSFVKAGAVLVGGCCGTTPDHIRTLAAAVEGLQPPIRTATPRPRPVPARASARQRAPELSARTPADSDAAIHVAASAGRFSDKLAAGTFVIACEMSPPESADAESAIEDAGRLQAAGCDAIVVAPVRSTRAQVSSASLALLIQQRLPSLEAVLTVTTWDRSVIALQADLLGAHAFGLRHVICRTGTPPLQGGYPSGIWDIDGVGLSQMLHGLNQGRDYHGLPMARPTAFMLGARIHPDADDFELQVRTVRARIAAGASYLISPPVFDVDALARLLDAVGPTDLPVLLGIMPLRDFRHAEYLQHEVPDIGVPEVLLQRMWKAGPRGAEVGLEIALDILATARARGLVHGVTISSGTESADEMIRVLKDIPR